MLPLSYLKIFPVPSLTEILTILGLEIMKLGLGSDPCWSPALLRAVVEKTISSMWVHLGTAPSYILEVTGRGRKEAVGEAVKSVPGGRSERESRSGPGPEVNAPLQLVDKCLTCNALIGVVGLGYVGLPVVTGFAETGFTEQRVVVTR
jgi:hypothetical protein